MSVVAASPVMGGAGSSAGSSTIERAGDLPSASALRCTTLAARRVTRTVPVSVGMSMRASVAGADRAPWRRPGLPERARASWRTRRRAGRTVGSWLGSAVGSVQSCRSCSRRRRVMPIGHRRLSERRRKVRACAVDKAPPACSGNGGRCSPNSLGAGRGRLQHRRAVRRQPQHALRQRGRIRRVCHDARRSAAGRAQRAGWFARCRKGCAPPAPGRGRRAVPRRPAAGCPGRAWSARHRAAR